MTQKPRSDLQRRFPLFPTSLEKKQFGIKGISALGSLGDWDGKRLSAGLVAVHIADGTARASDGQEPRECGFRAVYEVAGFAAPAVARRASSSGCVALRQMNQPVGAGSCHFRSLGYNAHGQMKEAVCKAPVQPHWQSPWFGRFCIELPVRKSAGSETGMRYENLIS